MSLNITRTVIQTKLRKLHFCYITEAIHAVK